MATKSFRRGAVAVLAYAVALVLLVILQFSRDTAFFESAGGVSVRGFYLAAQTAGDSRPAAGLARVDSITASIPGFAFDFSSDKPLAYADSLGKAKSAGPISYERKGDAFVIAFEGGIALSFAAEKESVTVTLSGAPQAFLRYANEPAFDTKSKNPALILQDGTKVPLRAGDLDIAKRQLLLSSFRPFAISLTASSDASSMLSIMDQAPMNPSLFSNALSRYLDKAWLGWDSTRFKAATVQWKGESAYAYSDLCAAAYIAEGYKRGKGLETLEKVRPARALYPGKLGYLTAPYFGNIVATMRALEQIDLADVRKIKEALQSQDPNLFAREGIVSFLFDRAPYALAQEAASFAQKLAVDKLSMAQAVGFLAATVESRAFYKDDANPFLGHEGLAERIIAGIRKTPDGFFLDSGDGSCDLRLSILAGWKLIEWGKIANRDVFVGVGQSLVVSAVAIAADDGALPASINLADASLRSGRLEAEAIYPIIAENPRYPREVSFFNSAGPGVWAWSVAPSISLTMKGGIYTFSADYAVGQTHYLSIYGLKPFKAIKLYGLTYAADPRFESYDASGYIYSAAANGLYLKMKHKKDREVIVLEY